MTNSFIRNTCVAVVCVSLAACSSVSVERVTSPNQPGIRYWRPAPFLALQETKTDAGVVCSAVPIMFPDKTEEYAINMQAGFGAVKATPTLEDGWNLTSLNADVDSKTAENITALSALIGALPIKPAAADTAPPAKVTISNCRGLFKLLYDPNTGDFAGFRRYDLPGLQVQRESGKPAGKPAGKPDCSKTTPPTC